MEGCNRGEMRGDSFSSPSEEPMQVRYTLEVGSISLKMVDLVLYSVKPLEKEWLFSKGH